MTSAPQQVGFVAMPAATVPLDVALRRAAEELGSPLTVTGGSGHGWSKYRVLQKCPYRYFRRYVRPLRREDRPVIRRKAMDVGSCGHAFRAFERTRTIEVNQGRVDATGEPLHPSALELRDALLRHRADAEIVAEAWRVWQAYVAHYDHVGDPLIPLAVEEPVKDPSGPDTARYDEIARVETHRAGMIPGIWIVEAKFVGRRSKENEEGWYLDGEILGQIALWKKGGMEKKYGPLRGVVVDVAVKTKVPQLYRVMVDLPDRHVRRQVKDLERWRALRSMYQANGVWPRALASCVDRYGFCEFWNHCREG